METVLMMERKGHCKCAAGKPDCPDCNAEGGDDTPPLLVREPDTERSSLAGEHTRQRPRRRLVSSQRMKDLAKTFASHHPVFQPSLDEREYQYQDFSGPKSCVADKYFDYHSEDVLMLGPRPGLEGSCQPGTPATSPDGDRVMLPSRSHSSRRLASRRQASRSHSSRRLASRRHASRSHSSQRLASRRHASRSHSSRRLASRSPASRSHSSQRLASRRHASRSHSSRR